MSLSIRWGDIAGLERFDAMLKTLGRNDSVLIYQRALSRAGDMAKTQVIRALTRQTGLKRKVIVKAVKAVRPTHSDLSYVMRTTGGDIALKYFAARETRRGVSAAPFGQRKIFEQTFIKGGVFPNRVALGMGGQVWQRAGSGRLPIEKQKSGVIIPAEMLKGETAAAFDRTVREVLPLRVAHELSRATGGAIS